jgi:hypothetical protein
LRSFRCFHLEAISMHEIKQWHRKIDNLI